MSHPITPPDPDATTVVGTADVTERLDVTVLAERIARLVIRGLVAHAAADDRGGGYDPDLDHHAPPRFGEHGSSGPPRRLVSRGCPSCGTPMLVEPDAAADVLCATCQTHGDLRGTE